MGESDSTSQPRSKTPREQLFQRSSPQPEPTPISKFGTAVRGRWPHKPALHLAQVAGVTERGAQLIINGERKVSARVAAAFLADLVG